MSWRWWDREKDPELERTYHLIWAKGSTDPADYAARYRDLDDRVLATALAREDAAETRGLDPAHRRTCHPHRSWADHGHDRLTGARVPATPEGAAR